MSLISRLLSPAKRRIIYNDGGDQRVIFELPDTPSPDRDSVLVFAFPKSGSVLLNSIVKDLTPIVGLPYVSVADVFFRLGITEEREPPGTSRVFVRKGYCYAGFRKMPLNFTLPIVGQVKKILLVRDPRDMLVSHYFSMRESHPPRGGGLKTSVPEISGRRVALDSTVDEYVKIMSPYYEGIFDGFRNLCKSYEVRLFKYEDVIYDKLNLISEICSYFEWDVAEGRKKLLAEKHDIQPSGENTARHVRQVSPGDHRRKLSPETIGELTERFAEHMQFFGYRT